MGVFIKCFTPVSSQNPLYKYKQFKAKKRGCYTRHYWLDAINLLILLLGQ
jgi:hypothetical protein